MDQTADTSLSSRPLHWYDTVTITSYHFGLAVLFQTMTPIVIPLFVQQFVGNERQGSFYGTIRLWSLMCALLVQSAMGTFSDRSSSRWGRRRPYILLGSIASLFTIIAIGLTGFMHGESGYWFLFSLVIILNISANSSQGALQGLIPDLVPNKQRGVYSGVKSLMEVPLPVMLIAVSTGPLIAAGKIMQAFMLIIVILTVTTVITMFVPEKPTSTPSRQIDWFPILRLALMTAAFTLIILGMGKLVQIASELFANLARSASLILFSAMGLITMSFTTMIGVWISIKLAIGNQVRQNPNYSWWVVNRLAFLIGANNVGSFAIFFLQGRLGLANEQAAGPVSLLIMFVGLSILLTSLPGGWLADRYGPKPLLIISGILAASGMMIIIIASTIVAISIGAIALGAATGLFFTSNWALGTKLVPQSEAGKYLGISNLAGAGAGAVGAYIGGPIADYFARSAPDIPGLGYSVLFTIYAGLFFFSVIAILKVRLKTSHHG